MSEGDRNENSEHAGEPGGPPTAARHSVRSAAKRTRVAAKLHRNATRSDESEEASPAKPARRKNVVESTVGSAEPAAPHPQQTALERQEAKARRRAWKEAEPARRAKLQEIRAQKQRTLRRRGRIGSKERMRLAWRESGTFSPLPDIGGILRSIDSEREGQPPRALDSYAARILSQHGEDGITYELLKRAGIRSRVCVELGSGHNGGNAGFLVAGLGFRGLFADGDEEYVDIARATFAGLPVAVETCWITRESINGVLTGHDIAGEIDYLGIDLDGVDWWIWEGLSAVSARVVVVEYNPLFGAEEAVVVPYFPGFVRGEFSESDSFVRPKGAFGASLAAFERLARRRGYRLVASAPNSQNAYFVREDLAPETPTISVEAAYRAPTKQRSVLRCEEIAAAGGPTAWARAAGFELVQISDDGVPL